MKKLILCISLLIALSAAAQDRATGASWSTTWGTSPEYTGQGDMPKTSLAGKTIRQVIHPSTGGSEVRLSLTNFHSDEPVEIKSVYIAESIDTLVTDGKTARFISRNGSTPWIDKATAKYLTFGGSRSLVIQPKENATSDATNFNLKAYHNLAITITYGEKVPEHATSHRGSRTTSYIAEGNVGPDDSLRVIEKTDHWYNILSLDVNKKAPVVAVLGNSITDGRGTTTNAQNRWTDWMSQQLAPKACCGKCNGKKCCKDASKKDCDDHTEKVGYGVINLGIGGNCVLEGGISDPLVKRYRDELGFHTGIMHLIIYEGTNDIGTSTLAPEKLAEKLVEAYKEIIGYAHSKGMKVFMATITPTKGNNWYSTEHEKARQLVNKWIRSGNGFEGVIDFDELTRDPSDNEKLREEYSDDWLHLNPQGYEAMGKYAAGIIKKSTNN